MFVLILFSVDELTAYVFIGYFLKVNNMRDRKRKTEKNIPFYEIMKAADFSPDLALAAQWCKNWLVIFSVKLIFHRHRSNTEFSPVTRSQWHSMQVLSRTQIELKYTNSCWKKSFISRCRVFHPRLKRFLDIWMMFISPFRNSYLGFFFPCWFIILSALLQLVVSPFLQEYWRF